MGTGLVMLNGREEGYGRQVKKKMGNVSPMWVQKEKPAE